MNMFRTAAALLLTLSLFVLTGCREVKEGADELADEVTGKKKIEKKLETEKKIQDITNEVNKQQQEALKNLTE